MARAAVQTTLSARQTLERTDGRRVLAMGEPELTPGRKVRGGSGQRVAATSPGAVRRAASGAPGSGRGRSLPAMSPLTQVAAVGLRVSAPSRAAPCVTFSVAPRQELGAARAVASWGPDSGRGVPGPRAPPARCYPQPQDPLAVRLWGLLALWPPRGCHTVPAAASRCRLSSRGAMAPDRRAPAPAPAQLRPAPPPRPAVSFSVCVPPTPAAAPSVWDPVPAASPARPGARAPAARGAPRTPNSQHAPRFGDFRPSSHVTRAPLRRQRVPAASTGRTPPWPSRGV